MNSHQRRLYKRRYLRVLEYIRQEYLPGAREVLHWTSALSLWGFQDAYFKDGKWELKK